MKKGPTQAPRFTSVGTIEVLFVAADEESGVQAC